MSGDYLLLIAGAFIWIGWLNWKLTNEVEELYEQFEIQSELIGKMAEELNKLGSPNVKKAETPMYNIKYE